MRVLVSTRLTSHARLMLHRREIALEWVEDALRSPILERQDEKDSSLTLAFSQVPEAGDKWLRVVYRMEGPVHVIVTAFFDRNQERRT